MSTTLRVYVSYMANWLQESDDNINRIISEQMLFAGLQNFSADAAIENEFGTLTDLAMTVRNETIAADAVQIAADAAAVAALWSFGFGMAAYVALEITEGVLKKVISDKSAELNAKLQTIDSDIATGINPNVSNYITAWKANNVIIKNNASDAADAATCRSILMQFLAQVHRKESTLDVTVFKKYANSASVLYNSQEIEKVYDALDTLNLSDHTDDDVKKFYSSISGLDFDVTAMSIVTSVSVFVMAFQLKIATTTIQANAKAFGFALTETDESALTMVESVGKFVTVVAVALAVVDTVLEVLDIVDVVEQCKNMCDQLGGPIKQNYHDYFENMLTASQQYNAAITASTS